MERLLRPVGAGLALAAAEWVVVFTTSFGMFLTPLEVARYLVASLSSTVVLALLGWTVARGVLALLARRSVRTPAATRAGAALALAAAITALPLLASVTSGRRVAGLALRWPAVAVGALVVGLVGFAVGRGAHRLATGGTERARTGAAISLALVVLGSLLIDALVLERLYPAFHLGLELTALVAALLFGAVDPGLPMGRHRPRVVKAAAVGAVLSPLVALFALASLGSPPNLRFVVEDRAPLTGALARFTRGLRPEQEPAGTADGASIAPAVPREAGFVLPDPDVLLVTVDALRADRLAAYGGRGLTPELDALAAESVVFRRAYTPTPHTSYALTSMLTGKYLRPVLELPDAAGTHPTLPEILRQYGHRTAAFYPPAIFFVDAGRFERMQQEGFGFEYRKEMYAPAEARVAQLASYLDEVDAEHPVLVWVHLFEPHEPYDPDPRFARGDSAEQRYDGEVAAADAAIGALVRLFRERRPGATVIVSADHGEEFGEHGGHHHGTTLYDEQVAIPLVWSSPGLAPRTVDAPVELVDVATTVLATLGIPRDARMRGDDLSGALLGREGPRYAFAEIRDDRMIADGRYKAICTAGEAACRLFDLVADPGERRDRSQDEPERADAMHRALGAFIGSIPAVEALAIEGEVGWPEALARAELGDARAAPDVVPLLSDPRAPVRAAAARALARLRHAPAAPVLARLRDHDADPAVRAELALASLALGDAGAVEAVRALATSEPTEPGLRRRASLLLARGGDAAGLPALLALATDPEASESARREALEAIGQLGAAADAAATFQALLPLLDDVRLRALVAEVLGAVGNRGEAAPALLAALREERYVEARAAEAAALARLGERAVLPLVRRFLGTDVPLSGGVRLLLEAGALAPASGAGGDLRAPSALLAGSWECGERGCRPGEGARLVVPRGGRPRGPVRVVLALDVAGPASLATDGGAPTSLPDGRADLSLAFARVPSEIALSVEGDARLVAFAVVPRTEEIPPPPPEPWEADAGAGPPQGPNVTTTP